MWPAFDSQIRRHMWVEFVGSLLWRAFLKRPENFTGPKLRPAYSVKLVLSYVVKGIKVKITAKFRDREHFRFEDTKRIMSPGEFGVFRETGPCTERFSTGTPVSPLLKNQHLT